MDNFGVSFLPQGPSDPNNPQQGGGSSPQQRIQQAVRILSLRLPRFQQGGSQIAPAPLLQGSGAQGSPFGHPGVLQTQQQQPMAPMLGGNPQTQALMQLSGMGAPTQPRVIPGLGTGPSIPPPPQVQQEWNAPQGDQVVRNAGPIQMRDSWGDQLQRKQGWMDQFLNRSPLQG